MGILLEQIQRFHQFTHSTTLSDRNFAISSHFSVSVPDFLNSASSEPLSGFHCSTLCNRKPTFNQALFHIFFFPVLAVTHLRAISDHRGLYAKSLFTLMLCQETKMSTLLCFVKTLWMGQKGQAFLHLFTVPQIFIQTTEVEQNKLAPRNVPDVNATFVQNVHRIIQMLQKWQVVHRHPTIYYNSKLNHQL